jgi:cytochrome c oxidase subunit IV
MPLPLNPKSSSCNVIFKNHCYACLAASLFMQFTCGVIHSCHTKCQTNPIQLELQNLLHVMSNLRSLCSYIVLLTYLRNKLSISERGEQQSEIIIKMVCDNSFTGHSWK